MTRDEFMDMVYSELHSDGDNYRANRIIDSADEYAEEQTRWISASEKPPEEGDYLVVFRWGWLYCREVCYFDGNTWDKGWYDEVVKWQYLPDIEEGDGK